MDKLMPQQQSNGDAGNVSVSDSNFPRFSTSCRTFASGGLSECVALKRLKQSDIFSDYKRLQQKIYQDATKGDKERLDSCFHTLMECARSLSDSVDMESKPQFLDESCICLLRTFIKNGDGNLSHDNNSRLLKHFGPFEASHARKACETVGAIKALIGGYRNLKLCYRAVRGRRALHERELCDSDDESSSTASHFFGDNLSVGETSDLGVIRSLEAKYHDFGCEIALQEQQSKFDLTHEAVPDEFNSDELIRRLSMLETADQNLIEHVFVSLESATNGEQLQSELFDMLGIDHFDLISMILSNRQKLVDQYREFTIGPQPHFTEQYDDLMRTKRLIAQERGPAFGQQIVIQSDHEKQLAKDIRKHEKKVNKSITKTAKSNSDFEDIDVLRKKELELANARFEPILERPRLGQIVRYPNVYDSYAEAQQKSSLFVGGQKMILPESCRRINYQKHEEVIIDAEKSSMSKFTTRVPISSLDHFAQEAFAGTKSLNIIQSLVYPIAYTSNENILVCAPTGAGKTNIAMMCILQQVKKHIENNVVKLNDFKIVYVAPMKALAAEMVRNFSGRLAHLGIKVKELTGDMQLTKSEILKTQMLITTPEKWDVVTRKSVGDVSLAQLVKLIILDEVHLLHDDRGSVIETLVARTLRQAEHQQKMIRIVGLSATLPNYVDVARFLRVNLQTGLFFFDGRFRPVPLAMEFVGVKAIGQMQQMADMDQICYDKVVRFVKEGHQVMVFVHTRNGTGRIATVMREMANNKGDSLLFRCENTSDYGSAQKMVQKCRSGQLKELFDCGFSIHHAGLLRPDRNIVEKLFAQGYIKVLCCTSTLAWGVNLPAHAVIIRGTDIYDSKQGAFVDLGILDVQQIFGRAGRPQFDTEGCGIILTGYDKLARYLSLLTRQSPIESTLKNGLIDCLNAEVSLGSVTSIEEGVEWLSFTYLFIRMQLNPLVYGLTIAQKEKDPYLMNYRSALISEAARQLDLLEMIRFNEQNGYLSPTHLGRTASNYYIKHGTIAVINDALKTIMPDGEIVAMVAHATEFNQIKVRDDELDELDNLYHDYCAMAVSGGPEHNFGKVNILLQATIARAPVESFSLLSDLAYVTQNVQRILRALCEMCLHKNWSMMFQTVLRLCKCVENKLWHDRSTPLRQLFSRDIPANVLDQIERRRLSIDMIREIDSQELGRMLHSNGPLIKKGAYLIPALDVEAELQPITRTVLKITLKISADFTWEDRQHGKSHVGFYIWVENPTDLQIYFSEFYLMQKKHVISREKQLLSFTVPINDPMPPQFLLCCDSDHFLGSYRSFALSLRNVILPDRSSRHTELLPLQPLPTKALKVPQLIELYNKFTHFNAVQTQCFFTLYHTDENVLLGAPTGSGKTIAAELAFFRVFNDHPGKKCVYIAPLKALVRERMTDWKVRIEQKLGKKVVELTGDVTPDAKAIMNADVIVSTPEKWDGISRSWQTRSYVKDVVLIVIDEIHLLGEDRGPVIEMMVSRTNFIRQHTSCNVRIVGLSTALANAGDLARWLNIGKSGLFNFRAAVRPVPLEVHIAGFAGKFYCPRMATMNKPAFQAIKNYSPDKPVLIFVASRRQTRLTAQDLVSYLAADSNPRQWLHMEENDLCSLVQTIRDPHLKLNLSFGIAIHHAGLHENDRKVAEELFVNQKIQVLICTSTLAWGVNFPAHLVIVKGTEYFDGKVKRYVDFPITDVLQMMGRAGRPQYDDSGVAVIFVHDVKKDFYKKFLYEPFPVESSLLKVFSDHLNAEIVAGTITDEQTAIHYLSCTYFFHRFKLNPTYYGLEDVSDKDINDFLRRAIRKEVLGLQNAYCVAVSDTNDLIATNYGRIASYYYLSHLTVKMLKDRLTASNSMEELIQLLTDVPEYDEIPVRHNEDVINGELCKECPISVNQNALDDSHVKTHLLYQAHFGRLTLPSTDYGTDLKSVLDQSIRIIQAMIDVAADSGFLATTISLVNLMQMVVQGRWIDDPPVCMLPHVHPSYVQRLRFKNFVPETIPELKMVVEDNFDFVLKSFHGLLGPSEVDEIISALNRMPEISTSISVRGWLERFNTPQTLYIDFDGNSQRTSIQLHADQEYILVINLRRLNRKTFNASHRQSDKQSRAFAPQFPKIKDESWFLMLGDVGNNDLIALKRISFIKSQSTAQLLFLTPQDVGSYRYSLYLMSDCYLGLDQQYAIDLRVISACIETQINSELID